MLIRLPIYKQSGRHEKHSVVKSMTAEHDKFETGDLLLQTLRKRLRRRLT